MKHLRNIVRATHCNALAISYLVTTTPLAYPVILPIATVFVTFMWILDPEELEEPRPPQKETP